MRDLLRRSPPILWAIALAVVAYATLYASAYDLRVLTVAGVYALAALGFHVVFGLGGALSLAQGAFFGLGAYATGILGSRYGLEFPVTFPVSLALPVVVALVVGLPVLRLESHYFALATLGVAQVALLLAVNLSWTGGANGLPGVPGLMVAGWVVPRGLPLAAAVWGGVAVGGWCAWRLGRGRRGRMLVTVRDDPLVAASLGIDVGRLRLLAFAVSAAYGGAAGALSVHTQRVVSPEVLEFPVMVTILTIVVVGGRERVAGAILGALLLLHLPEWLRVLERGYLLVYGVALLGAMVFAPDGLAALLARISPPRRDGGPRPRPLPATARPSGSVALRADGISKAYGGVRAVDGVSVDLRPGEVVGLIGPNGSGKTTLLNLLSGVERADTGRMELSGVPVTGARADRLARLGIARTFQAAFLPDTGSVLKAVAAARLVADASVPVAEAHAATVLDRLGIAELASHPCRGLSTGLRRRVDLARALARQPSVLLLDEPAAGLTAADIAVLTAAVHEAAAGGAAVLVVDHDMEFLLPLVGRVLVLDQGRLLYDGPADAAVRDPRVLAAYLGAPEAGAPA